MLRALLGAAALLLQFVLPAVHPQHAASALVGADQPTAYASPSRAAHQAAADDALACVFCAAAAQGRAGVLALAPAPVALTASLAAVAPPIVRLLAAPSLTRAAPRGPPALA